MGMSMGASWILAMWVVMMVAMMVPTAAHTTLFYAGFLRGRDATAPIVAPAALFLLAYVAAWTAFSAVATALQVGLERPAIDRPPPSNRRSFRDPQQRHADHSVAGRHMERGSESPVI
jgi:predicted metal-binding membrane protein